MLLLCSQGTVNWGLAATRPSQSAHCSLQPHSLVLLSVCSSNHKTSILFLKPARQVLSACNARPSEEPSSPPRGLSQMQWYLARPPPSRNEAPAPSYGNVGSLWKLPAQTFSTGDLTSVEELLWPRSGPLLKRACAQWLWTWKWKDWPFTSIQDNSQGLAAELTRSAAAFVALASQLTFSLSSPASSTPLFFFFFNCF